MDTTYQQVVLLVVNFLALLVLAWLARKLLKPYGEIRDRFRDLELLKLDQADLFDRFTAFQKRDGMRQARAGKESDVGLKEELEKLALTKSMAPQPGTGKAALRAKMRLQQ